MFNSSGMVKLGDIHIMRYSAAVTNVIYEEFIIAWVEQTMSDLLNLYSASV